MIACCLAPARVLVWAELTKPTRSRAGVFLQAKWVPALSLLFPPKAASWSRTWHGLWAAACNGRVISPKLKQLVSRCALTFADCYSETSHQLQERPYRHFMFTFLIFSTASLGSDQEARRKC